MSVIQKAGTNISKNPFEDLDWRLIPDDRPLSISEQIAEGISQAILQGEYTPGQRIPEQTIADRYQVSRGPVRDALRLLEREFVIEILPRRGAQVTSLNVEEVTDIFNIRVALLGLALRLTMEEIEPEQLVKIKTGVARLGEICSQPDSAEEYLSISFQLSLYIGRNSGNERLYEMVRSLSRQTVRYSALGLATVERRKRSARIWRTMLKAVLQGDSDAADRAFRTLASESMNATIEALSARQKT